MSFSHHWSSCFCRTILFVTCSVFALFWSFNTQLLPSSGGSLSEKLANTTRVAHLILSYSLALNVSLQQTTCFSSTQHATEFHLSILFTYHIALSCCIQTTYHQQLGIHFFCFLAPIWQEYRFSNCRYYVSYSPWSPQHSAHSVYYNGKMKKDAPRKRLYFK
jgi:hypothetical protein